MDVNKDFEDICKLSIKIEDDYRKFKDLDARYKNLFLEDFKTELKWHYDKNYDENQVITSIPEVEKKPPVDISTMKSSTVKKIYRELARKTHPDANLDDNGLTEDFKRVHEAYNDGDITSLLRSAANHNVKVDISEAEILIIKENISKQIDYIEEQKKAPRWIWASCPRTIAYRKKMWGFIGIDEAKFSKWGLKSGLDLKKLHLASIIRWKNFKKRWKRDKRARRKSKTGSSRKNARVFLITD
jgi:hypothetical protein